MNSNNANAKPDIAPKTEPMPPATDVHAKPADAAGAAKTDPAPKKA